jgi:hypothetical protein
MEWVWRLLQDGLTSAVVGFLAALGITQVKVGAIEKDVQEIKDDRKDAWAIHMQDYKQLLEKVEFIGKQQQATEGCVIKKLALLSEKLDEKLDVFDTKVQEQWLWTDEKFTMLIKELQAWKTRQNVWEDTQEISRKDWENTQKKGNE